MSFNKANEALLKRNYVQKRGLFVSIMSCFYTSICKSAIFLKIRYSMILPTL